MIGCKGGCAISIRANSPRAFRWATRLGLFALVIYVLVPIHVAFDLAESTQTPQQLEAASKTRSLAWRVLALLTGHHIDRADSDDHGGHRVPCPVLSAATTLAASVTVAPPVLVATVWDLIRTWLVTEDDFQVTSPLAAYQARAPPII